MSEAADATTDDRAEVALRAARSDLEQAGSPAYAVVGLTPGGPLVSQFVYAALGPALKAAAEMGVCSGIDEALIVSAHRERSARRWLVTDAAGDERLLTRDEVCEAPVREGAFGLV